MLNFKEYNLILEKRIGQIISNIEINYSLDVITTMHSYIRSRGDRSDIPYYDSNPISNKEVLELVKDLKKVIAEKIFMGEIKDEIDFIIKTVFRESDIHSFIIRPGQLVIEYE
jgi:hypothetical protein